MDSFGNSSIQGSSVPMNPMMAMIQRQQQEQQQYEALTAGTTMGVTATNGSDAELGNQSNNNTTIPASSSSTPSLTDNNNNNNNNSSYMNTTSFSQDAFQQRQIPTSGSLQQHLPQQVQQQQPSSEIPTMYSQARSTFPDMNTIPLQQQQPTIMQQQQHLMFNVGNLSPSHSPAPNHTQFYSNVDMQSSYYPDPTMADLQASYMNMVPPPFMSSAMDNVTSTYMPLYQSMAPAMMQQQQQQLYPNNYPHMSHSPTPHMFMANSNSNNNNFSAVSFYGSVSDPNFPSIAPPPIPPPPPASAMKMGYPTDNTTVSNLTSMPVQTQPTMLPSTTGPFQPRRDSSSKSMVASPTTPTHPPLPSSSSPSSSTAPQASAAVAAATTTSLSTETDVTPTMVTYIPKTRQVETYGGVDLKYFEKFEIRPAVPCWEELGNVDMTALTMSLRSGTKMELTNALNTLTTLTMQPRPLLLVHCDGLLDILLALLEVTIFPRDDEDDPTTTSTPPLPSPSPSDDSASYTYADLFELSLLEMKSLIPSLAPTSSQEWVSSRELRLCLLNILRNMSFMEENIDYLATHPRLCPLLVHIIQLTRHVTPHTMTSDLRCMDILEFRKCVLTIYANIAIATNQSTTTTTSTSTDIDAWVYLIHDFVVHGTDTYYATLAMEAWNKCSVHESHRRLLLGSSNPATMTMIQGIWGALIGMLRRQFYLVEMGMMVGMSSSQLGTLELVMMGLYNVVALADLDFCDALVATDPGVAMTLLRICMTLAEANNHHFRVVAQRSMETVYALVLGGGIKVAQLIKQQRTHHWQQQQQQHKVHQHKKQQAGLMVFPIVSSHDLDDEDPHYKKAVAARAQRLLYQTVLQEKLTMVMLKPAADQFILTGLDDLLTLMADMVLTD